MPTDTIAKSTRPKQTFKHAPQDFTEEELIRFWWFVFKTPTCWLWEGTRTSTGYGTITVCGKQMYTHRVSQILHFGAIPEGKFVLHDCPAGDQPACLNPAHLWLGTALENTLDALSKGRLDPQAQTLKRFWATEWMNRRGVNVPCHKLTEAQVIEIRRLHREEGLGHKRLHKLFPVSYGVIQRILNRTTWKHLP